LITLEEKEPEAESSLENTQSDEVKLEDVPGWGSVTMETVDSQNIKNK
jgi:hypothetical protein